MYLHLQYHFEIDTLRTFVYTQDTNYTKLSDYSNTPRMDHWRDVDPVFCAGCVVGTGLLAVELPGLLLAHE